MKLLSEAAESGLKAVLWMANDPKKSFKVKEIAEGIQAAPGYLVKVLQDLAKSGLVSAKRGSQGGFCLIRSPGQISALDVISAVDPIERIKSCPLKLTEHGQHLCELHRRIDDALAKVEETFRSVSIEQLLNASGQPMPLCNKVCEPLTLADS
jgi:Rrf2 family nitric oxide-sensitive transcriptional repressor